MSAAAGSEGDTVARNTSFSLITQVTTAVFTAGVTIFLVRALGPDSFGEFSLALAIGLLLLRPADLGIAQSTARFVAEHLGDRRAVTAVLADALRLKLITAVSVSVALCALADPIADAYGEPHLDWPLRGMALALLGQGIMAFWSTAFIALRRISLDLRVVFSESAVEATASIGLVLLGAGAAGAAFGRALGYLFGALLATVLIYRLLGRPAIAAFGPGRGQARRIARYAGAMLLIDTAWTASGQVPALVIGAFLSATEVGLYQAPGRLAALLSYPGLALANGVAPRMSRSGGGPAVAVLRRGLRWLVIVQVAVTVPILVWAEPLTELVLGGEYARSAEVLRALSPFILFFGLAPLLSLTVNYLGEARRRVPIAAVTLIANLVLGIVLVSEIGIVGAAVAADVSLIGYTFAHFWICDRLIGLPLGRIAVTAARSLLAGGAMAAVLVAFGTSADLGPATLLIGGVAGALAFGISLLILRELSIAELRSVRATVAARLRPR